MASKIKYLALLLLLSGKMAWPEHHTGSVIYVNLSKSEITMSADSKVTSSKSGDNHTDCKISAFGDKFAFEIAGLIKDDNPHGWDARLIARKSWKSESLHESDAVKLVQAVTDKWIAATKKIYSDPEYLRHKRLSHPESDTIANVVFAATDKKGKLAAKAVNVVFDITAFDSKGIVHLSYPSGNLSPGEWKAAGSDEIITEYITGVSVRAMEFLKQWRTQQASNPSPSARQADLATKIIDLSIRLHPHPERIGPPVDVLQIMPTTGIHWIQRKPECPEK